MCKNSELSGRDGFRLPHDVFSKVKGILGRRSFPFRFIESSSLEDVTTIMQGRFAENVCLKWPLVDNKAVMFYYPLTVFDIKQEVEQKPEPDRQNELRNKRCDFKVIQKQQNTGILKFVK